MISTIKKKQQQQKGASAIIIFFAALSLCFSTTTNVVVSAQKIQNNNNNGVFTRGLRGGDATRTGFGNDADTIIIGNDSDGDTAINIINSDVDTTDVEKSKTIKIIDGPIIVPESETDVDTSTNILDPDVDTTQQQDDHDRMLSPNDRGLCWLIKSLKNDRADRISAEGGAAGTTATLIRGGEVGNDEKWILRKVPNTGNTYGTNQYHIVNAKHGSFLGATGEISSLAMRAGTAGDKATWIMVEERSPNYKTYFYSVFKNKYYTGAEYDIYLSSITGNRLSTNRVTKNTSMDDMENQEKFVLEITECPGGADQFLEVDPCDANDKCDYHKCYDWESYCS